ncbi:hypothetical protein AD998_10875 [bacterium 336/3]|nr:hypothetical protein AD998_10875 [bacterium 336/3]
MHKKNLFWRIWLFVYSIGYAQTSVPLGFCNHSTVIYPDTIYQDYNNIKRFLGKYEAKLSHFQKKALVKEFKNQACWNTTPAYMGLRNYQQLLELWGIWMSQKEIEIWNEKLRKESNDTVFHYSDEIIVNHTPAYQFLEKPMVVDFDQNQEADVICIPQDLFGPASGYEIYAKKNGRWQSIANYAGSFEGVKKTENQIVIRYLVGYANSNAQIFLSIVLKKKGHDWVLEDFLEQYYAFQTQKPPKFLNQFENFIAKSRTILRTHTFVKDTGVVDEKTPTLIGNQVGIFPKGSKALILAKEKDWAFVAFLPISKPEKIIFEYDSQQYNEAKPYYCGWIQLTK